MIKCGELKLVKCPLCNKLQKTRATYFFKCCGIAHDISRNVIAIPYSLKSIKAMKKNPEIVPKSEEIPQKVIKKMPERDIFDTELKGVCE
jgi:hypothetical protein